MKSASTPTLTSHIMQSPTLSAISAIPDDQPIGEVSEPASPRPSMSSESPSDIFTIILEIFTWRDSFISLMILVGFILFMILVIVFDMSTLFLLVLISVVILINGGVHKFRKYGWITKAPKSTLKYPPFAGFLEPMNCCVLWVMDSFRWVNVKRSAQLVILHFGLLFITPCLSVPAAITIVTLAAFCLPVWCQVSKVGVRDAVLSRLRSGRDSGRQKLKNLSAIAAQRRSEHVSEPAAYTAE